MKYEAGDKVRVREDLLKEEYYDGCYVNPEMGEFAGRVVTISRAPELTNRYGIKEDNMRWCWTDEMFETLEDKNTTDETNVSEEWVLCKDDTESHADATEAAVDVNCLLEA